MLATSRQPIKELLWKKFKFQSITIVNIAKKQKLTMVLLKMSHIS